MLNGGSQAVPTPTASLSVLEMAPEARKPHIQDHLVRRQRGPHHLDSAAREQGVFWLAKARHSRHQKSSRFPTSPRKRAGLYCGGIRQHELAERIPPTPQSAAAQQGPYHRKVPDLDL